MKKLIPGIITGLVGALIVSFFFKYYLEKKMIKKEVAKVATHFVVRDTITIFEPNYNHAIYLGCDTSIFRSSEGSMMMVVETRYKFK